MQLIKRNWRFAGWVEKPSKDWATYLKNYTSYPSELTRSQLLLYNNIEPPAFRCWPGPGSLIA
jgi:hypothetical protein